MKQSIHLFKIKIMNKISRVFLMGLCLVGFKSQAQINPLGAQYFQNQYLANPAMAGLTQGYEIGTAVKGQWTSIEGAPIVQAVTLTYGSESRKVGVGLSFYNETAGILKRTSVKGTYTYHLPLNSSADFLDFGLSAGYVGERIDFAKVKGEIDDASLFNFNARQLYFDADFGMTYRKGGLSFQGVLPNLRRLWRKEPIANISDRSRYLLMLSYRLPLDQGSTSVEPKVVFRNVQNFKNIVDIGAAVDFVDGKLVFNGIYHTTGSVTLGMGTVFEKKLAIMFQYTTNTSDLQGYSNGEAELAVKYRF